MTHRNSPVGAGPARDSLALVGAGPARDSMAAACALIAGKARSHRISGIAGRARSNKVRVVGLLVVACLLSACVSQEPRQLVPSITLSPEIVSLSEGEAVGAGLNFGITAAVNESDSLSNITVLPGIRVRAVTANGAADTAGIRAGDVILSIDGREINHPDLLDALAQQTGSAGAFVFQVRRNTTVFETTVNASANSDGRSVPTELYRADPILIRAGFTTEVFEDAGSAPVSGARIVAIFPESPLPAADLRESDTILALNGVSVQSAQSLVSRLHSEFQPGDRVLLSVLRKAAGENQLLDKEIRLWDPGQRVSRVALGPLLQYESSLDPQQTRLSIGDLWLFSLFDYQLSEGEREIRLLSIFRFATGYGELVEETAP